MCRPLTRPLWGALIARRNAGSTASIATIGRAEKRYGNVTPPTLGCGRDRRVLRRRGVSLRPGLAQNRRLQCGSRFAGLPSGPGGSGEILLRAISGLPEIAGLSPQAGKLACGEPWPALSDLDCNTQADRIKHAVKVGFPAPLGQLVEHPSKRVKDARSIRPSMIWTLRASSMSRALAPRLAKRRRRSTASSTPCSAKSASMPLMPPAAWAAAVLPAALSLRNRKPAAGRPPCGRRRIGYAGLYSRVNAHDCSPEPAESSRYVQILGCCG